MKNSYFKSKRGIIISAIAFGIYHWFTNGVLGNVPAMVVVFLVTGSMGYVFAYSFEKTRSLVLPLGLHLGWNLTNHNIFSNGPNRTVILKTNVSTELTTTHPLIAFGIYVIVIIIALLFVRSRYIQRKSTSQKVTYRTKLTVAESKE